MSQRFFDAPNPWVRNPLVYLFGSPIALGVAAILSPEPPPAVVDVVAETVPVQAAFSQPAPEEPPEVYEAKPIRAKRALLALQPYSRAERKRERARKRRQVLAIFAPLLRHGGVRASDVDVDDAIAVQWAEEMAARPRMGAVRLGDGPAWNARDRLSFGSLGGARVEANTVPWPDDIGVDSPAARAARRGFTRDPLLLHFALDEPLVFHRSNVSFDVGQAEGAFTDWPEPETPWLALDVDGDGLITSGEELFGDETVVDGDVVGSGFDALARFDSNGDGQITAGDDRFADLVVWSDLDRDRVSQHDELGMLSDYGVIAIALDFEDVPACDARGNCARERARFIWHDTDGVEHEGQAIDVDLVEREGPRLARR